MKMKICKIILILCFGAVFNLNAESIYDLSGKWDALYETWGVDTIKRTIQISQTGNQFVGVLLNDNDKFNPKGENLIKGEISTFMLDKVSMVYLKNYPASREIFWKEGRGVILDMGNKMIIQHFREFSSYNFITTVTLTRKE